VAAFHEAGLPVIADMTGSTAYLSGSQVEHAPGIARDLLEKCRLQQVTRWTFGSRSLSR
jgi:hypothetical protein